MALQFIQLVNKEQHVNGFIETESDYWQINRKLSYTFLEFLALIFQKVWKSGKNFIQVKIPLSLDPYQDYLNLIINYNKNYIK